MGWFGKVEGSTGTLWRVKKSKELKSKTTYLIAGKVSDAAGNSTDVRVTFVTRGKE